MSACENCWGDAFVRSLIDGRPQDEHYHELLEERKYNPCSPEEQAGQFWDEILGIDRRLIKKQDNQEEQK